MHLFSGFISCVCSIKVTPVETQHNIDSDQVKRREPQDVRAACAGSRHTGLCTPGASRGQWTGR